MDIMLLTDNHCQGGLDTFIVNLLQCWPDKEDTITLFSNSNNPGLQRIKKLQSNNRKIATYSCPDLSRYNTDKFKIVRFICRYPLFLYYVVYWLFFFVFVARHFHKLMVINGGYPGSDIGRAACIAWSLLHRSNTAFCNYHSLVCAPARMTAWLESSIDYLFFLLKVRLITVSDACLQSLNNRKHLAKIRECSRIYNGVVPAGDFSVLKRQASSREEKKSKRCLMLANFYEYKGHNFLLEVFSEVKKSDPTIKLLMCGSGLLAVRQRIKNKIIALGLEEIITVSAYTNDIDKLYASADCLLVASQAAEAFGLVIIEAMSRKIPVVATAVGGIKEVLANNIGGFLSAHDDVVQFASHVVNLCSSKKLARRLAEQGYQRYLTHFTADKMAAEYKALLSS